MTSKKTENDLLASIVESSQDSIISVDRDMRVTSWNKAAEGLYGYSADAVVGEQLTQVGADQNLASITAKVKKIMAEKSVKAFDTDATGKGNKKLKLEVVMSPVKDKKGSVIGVSKIARDISRRRSSTAAEHKEELLRNVLSAQEDERARLARELHDELGQRVTALRFMLQSASDRSKEPHLRRELDKMAAVMADIDDNIDLISWELRPVALDSDTSLTSAINDFTRQWSRHSEIPASRVAALPRGQRLPALVDTNLYRIVQEAFHNIRKHSKATEVEMSLKIQDGTLSLIISDDGKGFNIKTRRKRSSCFGLIGMKERSELIGASFEVETAAGKGTTIYVKVPIPPE